MRKRKTTVTRAELIAAGEAVPPIGRPKREGAPNMRPLGVGRAWLQSLDATLARLELAGVEREAIGALRRDVAALIRNSVRISSKQSEAMAKRENKGRPQVYEYRVRRTVEGEPPTVERLANIEAAAAVLGIKPGSARAGFAREGGRIVRNKLMERRSKRLTAKRGVESVSVLVEVEQVPIGLA